MNFRLRPLDGVDATDADCQIAGGAARAYATATRAFERNAMKREAALRGSLARRAQWRRALCPQPHRWEATTRQASIIGSS